MPVYKWYAVNSVDFWISRADGTTGCGSLPKLKRALADDDKENAGWRAYWAGWVYQLRSQPAEVLICAARAAEHWQDSTPRNKATAIRLRGIGHSLDQDYPAAITAYREALEIYRNISPESNDVAVTLSSLAGTEQTNKDYSAAERDLREALDISKKNNDGEGIASRTGALASLALERGQWAEAESLAREALALAERVGRQELIASDSDRVARALFEQNSNLEEALSYSHRAVEIYTRLHMSDKLQWAQETLAEIEKALEVKIKK